MGKKARTKRERREKQQQNPKILEPPPQIAALIDAVVNDDRLWFAQNPGKSIRERPAVPGEFWPCDMSNVLYVLVMQVVPGFRLRAPVVRMTRPDKQKVN